jgi:muramidase (phage lysozyme)
MIALAGVPSNRAAFLDMIAFSELGAALLAESDNGYNILVGSTPGKPLLFASYADHPRIFNSAMDSTGAGRYQLLERYFDDYKAMLDLPDFSPESQDAIALQQIRECGAALDMIDMGNLSTAVGLCAHIWASLPGAGYGQPENSMTALAEAYQASGGTLA